MRSIGDHGDRSLIFSPKIRIENGSQSASVSFCIQRKIANYLEESKELLTFAALISLITLNCIRMKQKKARNCVKSCKMFASVESFSYFCR